MNEKFNLRDIIIVPKGQRIGGGEEYSNGNHTDLLHVSSSMEAVMEWIPQGTVGCIETEPCEGLEFNYIIKGSIEIYDQGKAAALTTGDSFVYENLPNSYIFLALEDTQVLVMRNMPCFQENELYVGKLQIVLNELQEKDGDTRLHCDRVKVLCMGIAYHAKINPDLLHNLYYAAQFHDVGKAKIPLDILLKPDKLTNDEYEIMKTHSRYTYDMIKEHHGEDIAAIAFEHHERLDGKGYPRGLAGDEIGLCARIICVADAYDAMTVSRPYRKAMSQSEALAELRRWQSIQFDKVYIDALEAHLKSGEGRL